MNTTETRTPVADARRYAPRGEYIGIMVQHAPRGPITEFDFELGLKDYSVAWSLPKWDWALEEGYTPEEIDALILQKRAIYVTKETIVKHFFC